MCIVIICLELITCSFLFIIGQSLFCSHAWKCWSSFCWLWRKSKADGGTKQIAYAILGSWISFSKAWTCLHLWADCGATRSSLLCRCSVPPRVQIKASKTFTSFYRWKPFSIIEKITCKIEIKSCEIFRPLTSYNWSSRICITTLLWWHVLVSEFFLVFTCCLNFVVQDWYYLFWNYAGLIMAATKQLGTISNTSNGYVGASD